MLKKWPYPQMIAHRGAGKLAPENTLAAIRMGHAYGYRMFEFDVKLSGDGTLLLMHDDTTNRTSDGRGRVAAKTWHQLALLDAGSWHSKAFAGEPIPTFWRTAKFCLQNNLMCNVEIKPCPGRDSETGAAVALEARELWREATVPPLLSSFSEAALAAAREAVPELPRALLQHTLSPDWLERCKSLECAGFNANWRVLTERVVKQAHAAGLFVSCYTCNDSKAAAKLKAWGVNGIITDAVDRLKP